MTTTYTPYTISELCTEIWENNIEHFEYVSKNKKDCACRLCVAFGVIYEYGGL